MGEDRAIAKGHEDLWSTKFRPRSLTAHSATLVGLCGQKEGKNRNSKVALFFDSQLIERISVAK